MRQIDADALKIALDTFATLVGFGGLYDRGQVMECIDAAKTVGGWISVKDRLPDAAGYECLVSGVNCFGQRFVFTAFTGYGEPGWWTNDKTRMRREIDETDNRLSPVWEITHWMPLPEPPKEVCGDA